MMASPEPDFMRTRPGSRKKLRRISSLSCWPTTSAPVGSRERLSRKIRNMMLQCRPITLMAPRWSGVEAFLEGLLPSLPGLQVEVVTAPNQTGKSTIESWNFLVQSLSLLGYEAAPIVLEHRAFQSEISRLIELIPPGRGLTILGAERLPMEALFEFSALWGTGSKAPLLISSSLETPALEPLIGEADASRWVDLDDLGETETAAAIQRQSGLLPPDLLAYAVRFTGGVPALVDAIGAGLARQWPRSLSGWWTALGSLGEDLKAAVEVALVSPDLAERLFVLRDGRPRAMEPRDSSLLMSGLVRRVRVAGPARVQLRAQALAFLTAPEI